MAETRLTCSMSMTRGRGCCCCCCWAAAMAAAGWGSTTEGGAALCCWPCLTEAGGGAMEEGGRKARRWSVVEWGGASAPPEEGGRAASCGCCWEGAGRWLERRVRTPGLQKYKFDTLFNTVAQGCSGVQQVHHTKLQIYKNNRGKEIMIPAMGTL